MAKRRGSEYSLRVKGLAGKDRKPKTYYFTLLETDDKVVVNQQDLETLVSHKLLEIKYKYGAIAVIKYPTSIEEHVSNSGKGHRKKFVEVSKGECVWTVQGYNPPSMVKADKKQQQQQINQ